MYKIINKLVLAPEVIRLDIHAGDIARSVRPGQFVVIISHEYGKSIPLSVIDADIHKGTITVVFREIGPSTRLLGQMAINEDVFAVMGPLGKPARIEKYGEVICAATAIATAQILPICRALREAGNKVIGVFGSGKRKKIMLEPQLRLACSRVITTSQDGLYERRGGVVDVIRDCISKGKIDLVYAAAPADVLKEIFALTRPGGIKTLVQLNTFISCGTGLCGSCRVKFDGKMALVCQDGPEFDAARIDFDTLRKRLKAKRAGKDRGSGTGESPEPIDVIAKFFPGLSRKIN